MKLGIDAFYLSMENNTGIGNNVLDVLLGISKIDDKNEYILFTPAVYHSIIAEEILKNKNFKIVIVESFFSSRRLWLQSLNLRKAILRNDVEIFWGGGEYIPVTLPGRIKTCATILDVVFKVLPETVSTNNKVFYNFLLPLSIRKTDTFTTISDYSKHEMVEYLSIKADKISVINCGIDLKKYMRSEHSEKKKIILFVGTLQPRKNLISLIRAFEFAADKIEHDLVIVGASGWKNSNLSEKILSLPESVNRRIHFKGFVSNNELIQLYQKAELFVAPSLHEGFGLIIAEAIACGTPVLTSRRGAIPEVFGEIPEYADPLSPEDIADKMVSILFNPVKMRKMSKTGFNYIKKYDIDIIAREYINFFNSL